MIHNDAESTITVEDGQEALNHNTDEDFENDELIAQILLLEFNKEHDDIDNSQQKFNKPSPIVDDYEEGQLNFDLGDVEEEGRDVHDEKEWDKFDILERKMLSLSHNRYKKVTEHNTVVMNKSKNSYKFLRIPPPSSISQTRISSKNIMSCNIDSKQVRKLKKKLVPKFKLDEHSWFVVYDMIENKQRIQRVNGILNIGQMAIILHADSNEFYSNKAKELPQECIIKVFKDDYNDLKTAQNNIRLRGEREMQILRQLEKANVHCPLFITRRHQVVAMSFIGEQGKPAPKMKDLNFSTEKYAIIYTEIIEAMKIMYTKANIIHWNLLEHILWYNDHCYFIDFGLSLDSSEDVAFYFLYKDCSIIIDFFERKGLADLFSPDDLLKYITGCYYNNRLKPLI